MSPVTGDVVDARVGWTEIDGVPVVHGDEPGPLRASLIFRVGRTDEYLHANGITHLAEHLALYALGQPPHYQNGSVRTCVTTFDTMGDAEQVVSFLAGTCEALAHLDADRLEAEARVIEVEAQQRGTGLSALLFQWRYGASGPGLWGFEEYAGRATDAAAVQQWADYVFRAENAVLVLSAPPPDGLRLPLPHGARLPVPPLEPVLPETPAQFRADRPQIGALAAMTRSVAASTYSELLRRRLVDRLRRDLAVSYSPSVEYDRYDAGTAHLIVVADVHPDHVSPATSALVDVVDELADVGVTEQELADLLSEGRRTLALADSSGKAFVEGLGWLLSGERTAWDAHQAETEALTPEDLLAPAREARDGMLYAVPAGADLDEARIPMAPRSSIQPPLGGRPLTRSTAAPEGAALNASPLGVERTWPDGTRATVRYDTCRAVLAWPSGTRLLIGPDATAVGVEPRAWLEWRDLVAQIDASTAHVVVPMPESEEPAPSVPAVATPTTFSWASRVFLAVVSILGGVVMALAATDRSATGSDRATFFALGAGFIWLGMWLARGAARERRRRRSAASGR